MPESLPPVPDADIDVSRRLGPLEMEVLRALSGLTPPVTVRQVCDALPREGYFAYQGILNCLNRLAAKGVLQRDRRGQTYVYSPAVKIEGLAARLVKQMVGASAEQVDQVICQLLEVDPALGERHVAELRKRIRRMKSPRRRS
jgi:predicted transcriptional regulator